MSNKVIFTSAESSLMIELMADLDPDKYTDTEVKALIYKCKSIVENEETILYFVP